jgi:hypothetical protein
VTDLVLGTAGVVLAAVWAGGEDARDIAATGGTIALGAATVLSREERIDRAMQRLDSRSLSKAGRLVRWLKKTD